MPKNFQNTAQVHSLHMLARLCTKSFSWFQEYLNQELSNVQAGFRKGRGNRSNCQHPLDHSESKGIAKQCIYFIDYPKAFDCVDHNKLENS